MSSHYLPNTKIPTLVFPSSAQASRHLALMIESLIRQNNSAGRPTVLGLPTGSTPLGLYRELIRLHKEAGLDLSRVISFNLDEYYPMAPTDSHSYRRWMHETFFDHVNIAPQNIHVPDGTILEARKVVIMGFGEHKSPIVKRALEGEVTDAIAASFLQQHADATFILDEAAAAQLTALRRPWVLGPIDWTPALIRRAVIWL